MTDLNDGTRPGPPVPLRSGTGGVRRAWAGRIDRAAARASRTDRAAARASGTDRAAARAASARRWPLSRIIGIALLVLLLFSLAAVAVGGWAVARLNGT